MQRGGNSYDDVMIEGERPIRLVRLVGTARQSRSPDCRALRRPALLQIVASKNSSETPCIN
jgi:hypothetical protein